MIEPPRKRNRIVGPQLSTNTKLSFGDQIRGVAERTGDSLDTVHRLLAIKLFSNIVRDTPVDEGVARGSWQASTGAPGAAPRRIDTGGEIVRGEIVDVISRSGADTVVYFTNRIPYIIPLEYGWSQGQAPEGMVRINIARFQSLMRESVAEAKGK